MLQVDVQQSLGALQLDAQLTLPARQITAVFGRSGAGKTSLVNLISGLSSPDRGRISLGNATLLDTARGINLAPDKRRIGYVFQDARLFPHYRVKGNLNYGRRRGSAAALFDTVVQLLGIEQLLQRYPATLSGGEKQRVAIGRALLTEPDLLLMDEPLASLDLPRKRELLPYLERLAAEVNLPILYVSHSLDEILRLADSMVLLDRGKTVLSGPVEQVWSSPQLQPWLPPQARSALLSTTLSHHHPDYAMSCLTLSDRQPLWVKRIEAPLGSPVRIRIRASEVSLVRAMPAQTSIRNILACEIESLHTEGEQVEVRLRLGGCSLWAQITRWAADELRLAAGERVFAQVKSVSVTREDWAAG